MKNRKVGKDPVLSSTPNRSPVSRSPNVPERVTAQGCCPSEGYGIESAAARSLVIAHALTPKKRLVVIIVAFPSWFGAQARQKGKVVKRPVWPSGRLLKYGIVVYNTSGRESGSNVQRVACGGLNPYASMFGMVVGGVAREDSGVARYRSCVLPRDAAPSLVLVLVAPDGCAQRLADAEADTHTDTNNKKADCNLHDDAVPLAHASHAGARATIPFRGLGLRLPVLPARPHCRAVFCSCDCLHGIWV